MSAPQLAGPSATAARPGGAGGSLVKVGNGTLTLAGTNSYTGSTGISGGTSLLRGDISSSSGVAVGPGAMPLAPEQRPASW
jgi:autotransporter-associated beta strand protein